MKFSTWKLCHNILPTLDRLVSRRVELESHICPLCNIANETNVHIGGDCSFTRDVLSTDEALAQVCFRMEAADFEFKEWLQFCWQRLTKSIFARLLTFPLGYMEREKPQGLGESVHTS